MFTRLNKSIDQMPRDTRFLMILFWVGIWSLAANYSNNVGEIGLALLFLLILALPLALRMPYIHGWVK